MHIKPLLVNGHNVAFSFHDTFPVVIPRLYHIFASRCHHIRSEPLNHFKATASDSWFWTTASVSASLLRQRHSNYTPILTRVCKEFTAERHFYSRTFNECFCVCLILKKTSFKWNKKPFCIMNKMHCSFLYFYKTFCSVWKLYMHRTRRKRMFLARYSLLAAWTYLLRLMKPQSPPV